MAVYTIELRKLVNSGYNVFDDSWNTYIPEHKAILCDKILRRYWFYEIGSETPDRFKHYLNEHLARIMPYYNQLYASELLKLVPLYNYWLENDDESTRTFAGNRNKVNRNDTTSIMQMAESLQRMMSGTSDAVGSLTGSQHDTWTEDKTGKQDETTHTDTTGKEIYHEDTTSKETEDKDTTFDGSETGKETVTDKSDGTKTVDTTASGTTSNTRRYSDTPQAQINEQQMTIEQQYLTNYTRDNGTTSSTGHESDVISNTENKTIDTTKTTKNTGTEDNTKNIEGTKDSTTDRTGSEDGTKNITYSEEKNGEKDISSKQDTTDKEQTTGTEHSFSNGSTQNNLTSVGGESETQSDKEGKQGKATMKGFVVSQSQLLKEYRSTFLNIDAQIIEELGNNFMGVF